MANLRVAAGSVLDTVTSTANAVGNLANAANSGISMLNGYVEKHLTIQKYRNKIELEEAKVRVARETALAIKQQENEVNEYLKEHPEQANSFKETYERFLNLLSE